MTAGGATFCQKCGFFSFKNVISCSQKIEVKIVSLQKMSIFPRGFVPFGSLCGQDAYFQFRKKFICNFSKSQFLFVKYGHFQLGSCHNAIRADAVIPGWGPQVWFFHRRHWRQVSVVVHFLVRFFRPKKKPTTLPKIKGCKAPFSLKLHQSTQLTESSRSLHFHVATPTIEKTPIRRFFRAFFFNSCIFYWKSGSHILSGRSPGPGRRGGAEAADRIPRPIDV